jgi:UDP-glucose 4-epimerase
VNILITGGAGYISSHITVALLENKHRVFLYDNLTNSTRHVIEQLNTVTGWQVPLIEGDICDTDLLAQAIKEERIDLVLHAAALKPNDPNYTVAGNIQGSSSLLEAMKRNSVKQLIYSSSAAVYGIPQYLPLDEAHPTQPINDYGHSKVAVEAILAQLAAQNSDWRIIVLRYFNVAGLHDSGLLKEHAGRAPRNLVSHIAEVARGNIPYLAVFGDDYPTIDGTFVRDYVHVMDVAEAHRDAVDYMQHHQGFLPLNIGTGQATSVLALVKVFENITGKMIPVRMQPASDCDVPSSCADAALARKLLGWKARRSLEQICLSEWLHGG